MASILTQIDRDGQVGVARINCTQLTSEHVETVLDELRYAMRYDGCHSFVLDMSDVQFVSSACLGALITLLQDLEHVRGRLSLASCRPDVAFLFKTTKLDMVIPLFDDVDEAKVEM